MRNIYIPNMCKILKIFNETETIKTFRVDCKLNHDPGQFVEISVFNFGEVPISISSFSKKYIELSIRRVGRVTNAIHRLKEGDMVGIRGPYGKGYPISEMKNSNINIIGGGCGVAPLRSVILYLKKFRKEYKEVNIFLGFRSPDDILFKKEIEDWMNNNKFKFNVYLTVDKVTDEWKYEKGVITKLLEEKEIDNENSYALMCGPPIMIKYCIETLKNKNFKDEQIYISLERRMKCGIGKCGHCMINDKYVCLDGPVFNYSEGKFLED